MPHRRHEALFVLIALSSLPLLPEVSLPEACEPGFTPGPPFNVGMNFGTSALADFDGDSDLDLTTGTSVLFGNGDGTFSVPSPFSSEVLEMFFDVVPRDFDGDGLLDLALTAMESKFGVSIAYGRRGTVPPELPFENLVYYPLPMSPWHLASADFDGDGRPDIVGVIPGPPPDAGGSLPLFLNQGGRVFDTRWIGTPGIMGHFLTVGDFDGDGDVDVAFGAGSEARLLFGRGDGTFGEDRLNILRAGADPVGAHRFRSADLDDDGRDDIVAAADTAALVYLGRDIDPSVGLPYFPSLVLPLVGWGRFLEIEDLNGDAYLDIATQSAAETGVLQVFYGTEPEGDAAIAFVAGHTIVTDLSSGGSVLATGDVNGDGSPDIVLTTEDWGEGSFCPGQVFLNDASCHRPSTAAAGDANADGELDLSDAVSALGYLFLGKRLACPGAAEVNGDATLDLSDSLYLLRHLFLGGEPPVGPSVRACW